MNRQHGDRDYVVIKAEKIRLNVRGATAPPSIYEFNVIDTANK